MHTVQEVYLIFYLHKLGDDSFDDFGRIEQFVLLRSQRDDDNFVQNHHKNKTLAPRHL
jgi:hypothetical protein